MTDHNLMEKEKEAQPRQWSTVLVPLGIIAGLLLVFVVTTAVVHAKYQGRIAPGVKVGSIDLGGMNQIVATQELQAAFDGMMNGNVTVDADDYMASISLFPATGAGGDLAFGILDFNAGEAAANAMKIGRSDSQFLSALGTLYYATIGRAKLPAEVSVDEARLAEAVREAFPAIETKSIPTDFDIEFKRSEPQIDVIQGVAGISFDMTSAAQTLRDDAQDFALGTLVMQTTTDEPNLSVADAESLVDDAEAILAAAPYTVSATLSGGEPKTWTVKATELADWLLPSRTSEGSLAVLLNAQAMATFIEGLHDDLDMPAQNARFKIDGGRVVEFAGSQSGTVVDDEAFFDQFEAALGTKETNILVAMRVEEPTVTTENVNNLGIKDILGVGTSSFAGSPSNRRANIRHGAEKLNGLLIAPDETVSLLEQLRPFTVTDGYFPELVIKGDEIKPEIGGGLCQIGTTTFRAAMNTGLEIVERRNHSLVVSYYNDPSNNNPGTDATIYDPSPDFKFKNDTGNYILLVTDVDNDTSMLTFTFWGTSDGRNGSYEPPQILTWSGYGAPVYKETTSLPEGKTECQSPHPGATTTFTYTVEYADGTKKEVEFPSSYRSLPKICLVGVASTDKTEDEAPAEDEAPTETTTTPETSTETPE